MTFVFDENVAYAQVVRDILSAAAFAPDTDYLLVRDVWRTGVPDSEWISELPDKFSEPVIVTGDLRILREEVEKSLLIGSGVSFVGLTKGWRSVNVKSDILANYVGIWPEVIEQTKRYLAKPSYFELLPRGPRIKHRYRFDGIPE